MTHDIPVAALLAALPTPAFLYGPDARIVAANWQADALAGRPLAGRSAASVADLFQVRLQNGEREPEPGLALSSALAGGKAEDHPLTVTAVDGRTLSIIRTTSPIRDGNRIAGALVVWREATPGGDERAALPESEAQYRNLVELSPDAILIHQDGRIVFANPAAATLTGAGVPESLVGLPVLDIVHPAGRETVEWNIAADLRGRESPLTTVKIVRRNGTSAVVQGRGSRVPFRGRPAVQVVLRDVTEEKRAEAALCESEERHALLLALGDRLRELSDPDEITAAASELIGRHLGAGGVVYCEADTEGKCATVRADWTDGSVPDARGVYRMDDRAVDEFYRRELAHDLLPLCASLEIPICRGGRLAAILAVQSADPRAWSPAEVELARQVGDRTWAAVQRARAEAARHESEARLLLALESAEIGIWDRDTVTDQVTISPQFLRRHDLEPADVTPYDHWARLIHPDDREAIEAGRRQAFAEDGLLDLEFRVVLPTCEIRWLQFKGREVRDGTGTPVRVIGVLIDVTARKRAEAALAESEADARSLMANMIDACAVCEAVVDEDGAPVDVRLVVVNPAFAQEFGQPASALVGRTIYDLLPDLDPVWLDRFLEVRRSGRTLEVEEPFPAVDRWYRMAGFPVRGNRVAVILSDITGRKQAELELARYATELRESQDQLQEIIEATGAGFFHLSLDAVNGMVSRRGAEILGFPAHEMPSLLGIATEAQQRVHPDDLPGLLASFVAFVETVSERTEMEFRVRTPGGGWRWVHAISTSARRDESGRVVELAGFLFDIDKRKRAEVALQRSNQELQRFAYVASHDLQEPLRAIVSFSQLLERRYRGQLDADADDFIGFIVEGGQRMQTLILDLLALSRIETQARTPEPTDAAAVLVDVARSMAPSLEEAGAVLEIGDLPVVMADATQLEQVFTNLVGNAIKYRHPDRAAVVRVSSCRAGPMVVFSVQDNGIGIEPQYHDRVFEMFQRLHTHEEFQGTGIGLAVVQRIVERHGGQVWIESVPGEGSTFSFTLPAA